MDNILVANETVEECRLKEKRLEIVKVDYEKAYDLVSWDFLYFMMAKFGFCDRWIGWIKESLESSSMSILVNGSPTKEFVPSRGLRQGDPMTLFLLFIAVEGLIWLVRQATEKNLYCGVEVGIHETKVGLLQFADNILFMCGASTQNIRVVKAILRSFELVSRLRVNFSQTKVGGLSLNATLIKDFTTILNYNYLKIPFVYLGVTIGGIRGENNYGSLWLIKLEANYLDGKTN